MRPRVPLAAALDLLQSKWGRCEGLAGGQVDPDVKLRSPGRSSGPTSRHPELAYHREDADGSLASARCAAHRPGVFSALLPAVADDGRAGR